ncbi:MAG: motility protein A [Defluviitaleaceae bacterium]|nr:motility protein A [Defluviitaleaceae bacterium]
MELGSIIGFISGIAFILLSIFITAGWVIGDAQAFVSAAGAMIVFGGTIASTFIAFKFDRLLKALKAYGVIFKPPTLDPAGAIDQIVALANTARKEGVLALEESTQSMDDEFLKKGINLIVDGTDPELVKGIMETELAYIEDRHGEVASVYEFMASQAPAYGMVGTMVGLILMLLKLDDPGSLGPNMSVAFITTFYGNLVANLMAGPAALKMRMISKEEVLLKTVLIEGMLSIQAGENPRIIEEKLKSFLAPALRGAVGAGGGKKGEEE